MSQRRLAVMLGATELSSKVLVYRWEAGLNGMSRANATLLEKLIDEHRAKYPPGKKRSESPGPLPLGGSGRRLRG